MSIMKTESEAHRKKAKYVRYFDVSAGDPNYTRRNQEYLSWLRSRSAEQLQEAHNECFRT